MGRVFFRLQLYKGVGIAPLNFEVHTPNCKNVVKEKWKKGKSQIGINYANKPNKFVVVHRISLLEFAIVLKLKDNKTENSSGEMQWLQMNPPWECGLISLFNSYLAFSFCFVNIITIRCMYYERVKNKCTWKTEFLSFRYISKGPVTIWIE